MVGNTTLAWLAFLQSFFSLDSISAQSHQGRLPKGNMIETGITLTEFGQVAGSGWKGRRSQEGVGKATKEG